MRRWHLAILLGLATGCSNAPLAGTLDCLFPSRARIDDRRDMPPPPSRDRGYDRDPLLPSDIPPPFDPSRN